MYVAPNRKIPYSLSKLTKGNFMSKLLVGFLFFAFTVHAAPAPDFTSGDLKQYLSNQTWLKMSPARLPIDYLNDYYSGALRKRSSFHYQLKELLADEKVKVGVTLRTPRESLIACDFVMYYHSADWGWLIDEAVEPKCEYYPYVK